MKKVFILSSFLILTIFIAIFFITTKKNSNNFPNGELKIFCWGQYIADGSDGSANILKEFEKEHKIKISSFSTFDSCEQMYAKLKYGNFNYDVIFCCDYMVKRLIKENMLHKIDHGLMKNFNNIMQQCKGEKWGYDNYNEYSIPYSWGHIGIVYNENLIENLTGQKAKDVVTGWSSLWDKRLKNQILMFINAKDSFAIAHKILNNSINTTNKDEILKAAELLKEQKPLVQAYVMDEMFDKMENNEAAISVAYSGDIVNMMKNNKNLRYCFPKEGSNIFIDTVCIPSNAKNKENAIKFIDFLCREDIALTNSKFLSYSTPIKKAWEIAPPDLKNNNIIYPPKKIIEKCEINMPISKEQNILMEKLWLDIKS